MRRLVTRAPARAAAALGRRWKSNKQKSLRMGLHKFKKVDSLLKRVQEKVAGNVFERPRWFEHLQRFPVDIPFGIAPGSEDELATSSSMNQSHPAYVLLSRMLDRRPSFKNAVFESTGEANITQRYFNRMYELIEQETPEAEAFRRCDEEFGRDIVAFETGLTTRQLPKGAIVGEEAAVASLELAIEADFEKHVGGAAGSESVGLSSGFRLGEGRIWRSKPYTSADVKAYETEVSEWFDRSVFPWAHRDELNQSKVLWTGLTEKEMNATQEEMEFAIDNRLRQSSDGKMSKMFSTSLVARRFGNEPRDDGKLTLDEHRELCHLVMYVQEARRRQKAVIESTVEVPPPLSAVEDAWKARGDVIGPYFDELGLSKFVEQFLKQDVAPKSEDGVDGSGNVDPGSTQARILTYKYLSGLLEADPGHRKAVSEGKEDGAPDHGALVHEIERICGLSPLPEEKDLAMFLRRTRQTDALLDNGLPDTGKLRDLMAPPACLDDVVQRGRYLCDDLAQWHSLGDAPQTSKVRGLYMGVQEVTDYLDTVMMHQRGCIFTTQDLLQARELYRGTIVEGRIPKGAERQLMSLHWNDIEQFERELLLMSGIIPTMTISQFDRLPEETLSRIVPMGEPLEWKDPDMGKTDWLFEVGVGKFDAPDVQKAINTNMILPARVRCFVLDQNRDPTVIEPYLGGNLVLEERLKKQAADDLKYRAFGGMCKMEPIARSQVYMINEKSNRLSSLSRQFEARVAALSLATGKENVEAESSSAGGEAE